MSNFVTRSGTTLQLNGSQFNFSGCNAYWLGLLESPTRYPTPFDIDDALLTAKEMGASVIRAHTLGISTGNSLSVWPSLNTTNTTAFNTIDYAIYKAGLLGLKLIIPLTDNYHFYHGGKHNFTDWEGISDETQFYSNSTVIADFEAYISVILNRVNQYNSLAYKNDPTILAWQTGNELSSPFPGSAWTTTIANYIKSIDSNHLVMDGSGTLYAYDSASLSVASIDIIDDHFYPPNLTILANDISAISAANKVYVIGEYDWVKLLSQSGLSSWLSTIESSQATIAGNLFWSLFPHNDAYGWITHNDGYSMYYPGANADQIARSHLLRTHAYKQQGVTPAPAAGTMSAAPADLQVTSSVPNTVAWQGVAGAASYIVERAPSDGGPWTIASSSATDFLTPFPDAAGSYNTWYRVAAVNYDGGAGPFSPPVTKGTATMNTYIDCFDYIRSTSGLEWQSLVGNTCRFTTVQTQGASVLSVPGVGLNSVQVQLNMFDRVTILDGSNTEVVQVGSAGAAPGATSIPLLAGTTLAYSHAVGVAWCSDGAHGSLADQIVDASAWIEKECYQSLLLATYTKEQLAMPTMRAAINNDGELTFRPRHWPIGSISAISIAWTPKTIIDYDVTEATIDGNQRLCSVSNLVALPTTQGSNVVAPAPSRSRRGQVLVTYQAGYVYSQLPGDLKEAAILITSDLLAKRHNPVGAADIADGSTHISAVLRGDLTGESILTKKAQRILAKYSTELY